jgi:hypothetical protein
MTVDDFAFSQPAMRKYFKTAVYCGTGPTKDLGLTPSVIKSRRSVLLPASSLPGDSIVRRMNSWVQDRVEKIRIGSFSRFADQDLSRLCFSQPFGKAPLDRAKGFDPRLAAWLKREMSGEDIVRLANERIVLVTRPF